MKRYIKYLKGSSAFVFKAGFGDLVDKLAEVLEHNNVKIVRDSDIQMLKEGNGSYDIHYSKNGKLLSLNNLENGSHIPRKEKDFDFIISNVISL